MAIEEDRQKNPDHPGSGVLAMEEVALDKWQRTQKRSDFVRNFINKFEVSTKRTLSRGRLPALRPLVYLPAAFVIFGAGVFFDSNHPVLQTEPRTPEEKISALTREYKQITCSIGNNDCLEKERILYAQIDGIRQMLALRPTATPIATPTIALPTSVVEPLSPYMRNVPLPKSFP